MISNIDEQFQPRVGGKSQDKMSALDEMRTEFLVLFAELRMGHLLEDDGYLKRPGVREYLSAHVVGTMLMTMHQIPEVRALTVSKDVMIEAKRTVVFWLNESTFKPYYDHFDEAIHAVEEGDIGEFVHEYESAMFELREYFVTHSVFAGMCLKVKNVQTFEDNLKTHFEQELKRTKCDCHNCEAIKKHFKL